MGFELSKERLEAFSDGVIAILITVMVFDLKLDEEVMANGLSEALLALVPKILSYLISFSMLAIMWVSHHQLFRELKRVNPPLLWMNMLLLFWMSMLPFATHVLGEDPRASLAISLYAGILFGNAFAFYLIRRYLIKRSGSSLHTDPKGHGKVNRRNLVAMLSYALAALLPDWNIWFSYGILIILPLIYFGATFKHLGQPEPNTNQKIS